VSVFGYVNVNPEKLEARARGRYMAYYCGLCRVLKARYGNAARLTLSYDMTFLLILLSSLYEPAETCAAGRCLAHPIKKRPYVRNEIADYAADMNIALAYHKCADDWADDRDLMGLARMKLLSGAYRRVADEYPQKCARIAGCLKEISAIERAGDRRIDPAANLTASMLGDIFAFRPDIWQTPLRAMGEELGRFIYMMDAYEDLPDDIAKGRHNPLTAIRARDDFEDLCRDGMLMMMSGCARAFDVLPLGEDADILYNILYGGVWRKYVEVYERRKREARAA
jgi:hypothetical protein